MFEIRKRGLVVKLACLTKTHIRAIKKSYKFSSQHLERLLYSFCKYHHVLSTRSSVLQQKHTSVKALLFSPQMRRSQVKSVTFDA